MTDALRRRGAGPSRVYVLRRLSAVPFTAALLIAIAAQPALGETSSPAAAPAASSAHVVPPASPAPSTPPTAAPSTSATAPPEGTSVPDPPAAPEATTTAPAPAPPLIQVQKQQETKRPGPLRLDYQEGQSIPPGYSLRSEVRPGLLIAGGVSFWGGYIASSAIAWIGVRTQCELQGQLANCPGGLGYYPLNVPFAGPIIGIYTLEATAAESAGLIALSSLQVAGAALALAGLVIPRKELVRTGGLPLVVRW